MTFGKKIRSKERLARDDIVDAWRLLKGRKKLKQVAEHFVTNFLKLCSRSSLNDKLQKRAKNKIEKLMCVE